MVATILGRTILLAGTPTLPVSRRLPTGHTAIMGAPMPRPERPFASFEQTQPGLLKTALWPRADVPQRMTMVHGRSLLPLFKSRSEASTSPRGDFFCPPPWKCYSTEGTKRAALPWRTGRIHRAILARFQSAADSSCSRNSSACVPMVRLMCSKALTETVCWNTACNCSAPTPNAFSTQNSCENSSNR